MYTKFTSHFDLSFYLNITSKRIALTKMLQIGTTKDTDTPPFLILKNRCVLWRTIVGISGKVKQSRKHKLMPICLSHMCGKIIILNAHHVFGKFAHFCICERLLTCTMSAPNVFNLALFF